MKNWYAQLRLEYQVALWSAIVVLGLFVLCIPFYFFSLMEIPQGILLGGTLSILIYIVLGLVNNEEKAKQSLVLTIVVIAIKMLLIGGLLFLVGWLYYGKGVKPFNLFAVAGGYFIPLVIHVSLSIRRKDGHC